jgi:hypothetical protein
MTKVLKSDLSHCATIEISNTHTMDFRIKTSLLDNEKSCIIHGCITDTVHKLSFDAISPNELRTYIRGLELALSNYEVTYRKYWNKDEEEDDDD